MVDVAEPRGEGAALVTPLLVALFIWTVVTLALVPARHQLTEPLAPPLLVPHSDGAPSGDLPAPTKQVGELFRGLPGPVTARCETMDLQAFVARMDALIDQLEPGAAEDQLTAEATDVLKTARLLLAYGEAEAEFLAHYYSHPQHHRPDFERVLQ